MISKSMEKISWVLQYFDCIFLNKSLNKNTLIYLEESANFRNNCYHEKLRKLTRKLVSFIFSNTQETLSE